MFVENCKTICYSGHGNTDMRGGCPSTPSIFGRRAASFCPPESLDERRDCPMSDYEIIMIVLTILGIIVKLLIELIKKK